MKKNICGLLIISFFLCTLFPITAFSQDNPKIPIQKATLNISNADVITFSEAVEGKGDLYLLRAQWSLAENKLVDNMIIPVVRFNQEYSLLGPDDLKSQTDSPKETWYGFREFGMTNLNPPLLACNTDRDHFIKFNTHKSAPNINIILESGDILSFNLLYLEDGEVKLVEHTTIAVKYAYDYTTYSSITGDILSNWYCPDLSEFRVMSHFQFRNTGEGITTITLTENPVEWAKALNGLYRENSALPKSHTKMVAFDSFGRLSAACQDFGLNSDFWSAKIYVSPIGKAVSIDDRYGLDFKVNAGIWLGDAKFDGGAPIPDGNPYNYCIDLKCDYEKIPGYHLPSSRLTNLFSRGSLSSQAKEILGLSLTSDDSDGDGISDIMEIALNSDPLDPYTEGKEFNDFEMYFEMGMLPPLTEQFEAEELRASQPRRYTDDGNPSTTIKPQSKRFGPPIKFKHQRLIRQNQVDEASELVERVRKQYIYKLYGEEALFSYANRSTYHIFADITPWGVLDSLDDWDRDGLPNDLEIDGTIFGGSGYLDYGIHYWEEDLRLPYLWTYEIMDSSTGWLNLRNYIIIETVMGFEFVFIKTNPNDYDTDGDGLKDYYEYLWHSCPLLRHSNNTPGAPRDNTVLQQHFLPPRPDWVSWIQDMDQDSIPNGAELYYLPQFGLGPLDPWCASSDWDQYSDRSEWMSWFYKSGSEGYPGPVYPYPLDDPLPFVVRNGCHPLIPAYPKLKMERTQQFIRLPFSDVISSGRGIETAAEETDENLVQKRGGWEVDMWSWGVSNEFYGFSWSFPGLRSASAIIDEHNTFSRVGITESWDFNTTISYDYSQARLITWLELTNIGTEPFDYNPYGDNYFSVPMNLYWPGNPKKIFAPAQVITGIDGLIPSTFVTEFDTLVIDTIGGGGGLGGELFAVVEVKWENILYDYLGSVITMGSEDSIPSLAVYKAMMNLQMEVTEDDTLITDIGDSKVFDGVVETTEKFSTRTATATLLGLSSDINEGLNKLTTSTTSNVYRKFINHFADNKEMLITERQPAGYNTGADGVFSCNNRCDYTSIRAANRSYVTLICVYPHETVYMNMLKETPIRDEEDIPSTITHPSDSFYYLGEFIDLYSPLGDGPPKIEQFYWASGTVESLYQVGKLPNNDYGSRVLPEDCTDPDDSVVCYGRWLIISSIDTITNPDRLEYLPERSDGSKYLGENTILRPGDVFMFYYIADQDADTLEDQMEAIFGTNPYNPDTDGDGLLDGSEIIQGLDPLNRNTDNSYYNAYDGDEIHFLTQTEGIRVPVETFDGDTVYPDRPSGNPPDSLCWDDVLNHSPRTTTSHFDFVPWLYNSGGYNSQNDDKYMDANRNGLADWVEKYFRDPNLYWNGKFMVTWDGDESRFNPFGYTENIWEMGNIARDNAFGFEFMCDTFTFVGDGNRALQVICEDISGEGAGVWDNSYVYFKLFNANINVSQDMELSYLLWPRTALGKQVCIDFLFSDNTRAITESAFVDINGDRMHPGWRSLSFPTTGFHRVFASLAPFAGKTITAILVGYEDDPNYNDGLVHAFIDNLSIQKKNIIMNFGIENHPPSGFNTSTLVGDAVACRAWDNNPGTPLCTLACLPTPDPFYTTSIPIDTFAYGPRDTVVEVNAYLDPFDLNITETRNPQFTFSLLPENLDYRIDEYTILGYYIWQEHSPQMYINRSDLQQLNPPKVVVDLLLINPETSDTVSMLDYLRSIDKPLEDQFGNSLFPTWRNESDPDGNLAWRPLSGDFWRYIDVVLPDFLTDWIVKDILIRYETDLPCVGNLRAFIDQVSLFQRKDKVYVSPYHISFGDNLTSTADNNGDKIVDVEEISIHNIPAASLYSNYAKITYASLLLSNYIGPWDFEVESGTDDTTWLWFAYDLVTGDTSWSWYIEFAMDTTDSTFKLPKVWIADEDMYTTVLDVDSFMVSNFNEEDPRIIFGYASNVPGDEEDIYNPRILNWRNTNSPNGLLNIKSSFSAGTDSTLLFDINNAETCTLCAKQCLFMMYSAWITWGSFSMGYKLTGKENIEWMPPVINTTSVNFRHPVPTPFPDSTRLVESVWIKTAGETQGYLDNFVLRKAFYRSFEPAEITPPMIENNLIFSENINAALDTCQIYHVDDAGLLAPTPTQGDHYLKISGEFNGFSPARFRYDLFKFPTPNELLLTTFSSINFNICYNFTPPLAYGNCIVDFELMLEDSTIVYLYEYCLRDHRGFLYEPTTRRDPVGHWENVNVNLSPLPENTKVRKISVFFYKPNIVMPGDYEIYIDELLISF
ncbi:hypothetical protein JXI42_06720 [bacterium]|nr:hypothetical protein [bacterium]